MSKYSCHKKEVELLVSLDLRLCPLQALDKNAESLQKAEKEASDAHEGMWQYGDPGDDSDEEVVKPKNAWGRR